MDKNFLLVPRAKRSYQDFLSHQQLPNNVSNYQVSSKQLHNTRRFSLADANELARSNIEKTMQRKIISVARKKRTEFTAAEGLLFGCAASEEWQEPERIMCEPQNIMQDGSNDGLEAFSFHTLPVSSIPWPETALEFPLNFNVSNPSYPFSEPIAGLDESTPSLCRLPARSIPVCELFLKEKFSSGSETLEGYFSGNNYPKNHTSTTVSFGDTQPNHNKKVENPVLSDDWSLIAIVLSAKKKISETNPPHLATGNNERHRPSAGTSPLESSGVYDNQNMGNVSDFLCSESCCLSVKQHMECSDCNVKSDRTLRSKNVNYNGMPNLLDEPLKVHAEAKMGNVNASFCPENCCLSDKQQMEFSNTRDVKFDPTLSSKNVNYHGMPNLHEEPPIVQAEGKIRNTSASFFSENRSLSDKQQMRSSNTSNVKSDPSLSSKNVNYDGMPNVREDFPFVQAEEMMWNVNSSFRSKNCCLSDKQQMVFSNTCNVNSDLTLSSKNVNCDCVPNFPEEPPLFQAEEKMKLVSGAKHGRLYANCYSPESTASSLCGVGFRENGVGISLIEFFTAEQIKIHLHSLNPRNNLNLGEEAVENTSNHAFDENTCQLCAMDKIKLALPPMYCSACGARIKCNLSYYWAEDETGRNFCCCTRCFKGCRSSIPFKGLSISKEKLCKAKNSEEAIEDWVKCDKCDRWQHQVCALYNSKEDLKGEGKYICPFCRLVEMTATKNASITPAIGARDLPRTMLSDHIEEKLFRSLERERKQRAEACGKSPEEVPGVSDLTVRVVLSVNEQVSPKLLNFLHREKYPTEFPYRSKVILLFQKVEGVDVCLFAMYVQEYGSECEQPNKRSVYISYLDSVKYFRPEIKTVDGEALRTFVYHEIMIGYLSYCKQCGFTTCYIWACPPLKGDDYIFNCHPETQKTPKNLKPWYKEFLRKAKEEEVVVEYTSFYDKFFIPSRKDNHEMTTAQLPYFNGDFWSGATEDIIRDIKKENEEKSERKVKKPSRKRSLRSTRQSDSSVDATVDVQVMEKLGRTILPVKEDIFVVQLHFTCVSCHEAILVGDRWSCNQCCFHLCNRCHNEEKNRNGLGNHMKLCPGKHLLFQSAVNVPEKTDDKDITLDNEFFEDRHSFLSFCQKNLYQFDTLRRAKYSSMMILYHIRKMTELTIRTICSICQRHTTVKWHCEVCSEFLVCAACYQKEGDGCHVHKLNPHSVTANLETTSKKMQQQRASETKALLNLLEHANQCTVTRGNSCSYPKCQDVRRLFFHNRGCERRTAGGCSQCKKIWLLLCLHARNCRDSSCNMPRCLDIKNCKEKIAAQSEVRRRAAAKRQRLQHS